MQDVAVKVLDLGGIPGGFSPDDPLTQDLLDNPKQLLALYMRLSWRCASAARYLGYALVGARFCVVMRLYPDSLAAVVGRSPGGSDGPDGSDGSDGGGGSDGSDGCAS